MELYVYFNGNFVKASEAAVSIYDHGFLYGDGLFETMRVYDGIPFKFDEHMDRFYAGAQYLRLDVPLVRSVIKKAIAVLLDKNNLYDAVARVMMTRGEGGIGVDISLCPQPTVLITVSPFSPLPEEVYTEGVKVGIVSKIKPPAQSIDSSVKSNNYLTNILARAEARERGLYEGVMLSIEGYVAECATSNIFMIAGDEIVTPALQTGALNGITRGIVMEIAHAHDIPVEEKFIVPEELYDASECFITSSVAEIVPVVSCDGAPIGGGSVGLVTMNFMNEYRRVVSDYVRLQTHGE
ncbi:MAG TPA: aminotransferase class IV [bacterium]|nr:aminotransferase class IV [bacterium]